MKVYKFDKIKGYIEPKPGDIVELDGSRLKVVEDADGLPEEVCHGCVLEESLGGIGIRQECIKHLCSITLCGREMRDDGKVVHYEEVKDGQ